MLTIEAFNFNAGAVKSADTASGNRNHSGDESFANLINEAQQGNEAHSIQGKKPKKAQEDGEPPGQAEQDDGITAEEQMSAGAALYMLPIITGQTEALESAESHPSGNEIISILEGTSPSTDITPPATESAAQAAAANEGETARMPQKTEEAFAITEAAPEIQDSSGAVGRPVISNNDAQCPLENENDAQALAAAQMPEVIDKSGGESEQQGFGESQSQAGTAKPEEIERQEKSEPQVAAADKAMDIAPDKLESAIKFEAEVIGSEKTEAPVRPSELFDALVERMEMSSGDGSKSMVIQLKPEFLGKVQIELALTDNGLSAKILTEDTSVRGLLQSHVNQLIETLNAKSIRIDEVEVLYTGVSDHEFDGSRGKQNAQDDRSRDRKGGIIRVESALEMAGVPYMQWEMADSGLYADESSVEYTA